MPPAAEVTRLPVAVTIRGAHFLGARVSLDDKSPAGIVYADASIGGEPLMSVSVIAPDTLTGYVPATLPVGTHDVEVRLANGERGVLAGGFTVLSTAIAPTNSTPPALVASGCNAGEMGAPELVWPDSMHDERGPSLSSDRLTIVFSRAAAAEEDIYQATRPSIEAPFGPPQRFDEFTGGRNTTPTLSADERTIYFASDRTGNWDIWVADRSNPGLTFGNLRQLLALNSTANELRPWLSADQRTIYFESDRMGMGADIWMATRPDASAEFATPQQVTGLNTPGNEGSASTTPDQLTCFYVSDSAQAPGWGTLLHSRRANAADSFSPGIAVARLFTHNMNGYASLSTDGRELVFSSAGLTQQIWRVLINCAE